MSDNNDTEVMVDLIEPIVSICILFGMLTCQSSSRSTARGYDTPTCLEWIISHHWSIEIDPFPFINRTTNEHQPPTSHEYADNDTRYDH